ncbi:hypothetical protein Tco_0280590 [Tanacetum coccineum]
MTVSLNKELVEPYDEPKQVLHSLRKLFMTTSFDHSSLLEFELFSDHERPKFDKDVKFELKGQFLKELREHTFSGLENKDANEHIERVLEIVDLFTTPNVTPNQLMLCVFPITLTRAASRWLRNEPACSITTWEILKGKFLSKYCPPSRTAKKIEEINNFQQEPDETLYQAWEGFKELLLRCPQHYLTKMADHSQKWHDGTSTRSKSSNTSDGLAAIQAQLNNLSKEIKKVNERVYDAQVGTFKDVLSQNMQNLGRQLNKETLHEKDSNSSLSMIKVQFDNFIHSRVLELSNSNSHALEITQDCKAYINIEAQTFKETIIQNMDSIKQCIVERARHEQELQNRLKRLNERKLQIQECKIQEVNASNTCLGDTDSSGIVSDKGNDQSLENHNNTSGNESSRSRNE